MSQMKFNTPHDTRVSIEESGVVFLVQDRPSEGADVVILDRSSAIALAQAILAAEKKAAA